MSTGWRVWLAFEVRPGITDTGRDMTALWRSLADSCRRPDGTVDHIEFDRWMNCIVEHTYLWGTA